MKSDSILRYLFYAITALKVLIILFIPEFRVWEPEEMALNLLEGKGFYVNFLGQHNYNYQFPLYPFCIYMIYSAFGPIQQIVVVLNIVLYSLATLFMGKVLKLLVPKISEIGEQFFNLIVLLYPATNVYVLGNIHPFALDLLLCVSGFYFGLKWSKSHEVKDLLLAFFILALILVDRITLLFAPAIGIVWGLWQSNQKFKHLLYTAGLSVLALLPLASWMYSTYQHNHSISIMSSTGVNLWIGIQQDTEGTAQLSNGDSYLSLLTSDEISFLEKSSPMQQNIFFTAKYWQERQADSNLWDKMMWMKLRNFWWFRTDLGVDYSPQLQKLVVLYKVAYALLLFAMLWGMILHPEKFWSLTLLLIGICFFQAWFYVETRHRVLIEPFMLLMAFTAVYEFYTTKIATRQTIF